MATASGKPISVGLIVGKFAPLHLGHEWLIERAAQQCGKLIILSYVNPEFDRCPTEARRRWLVSRFPSHRIIVIDGPWLARECADRDIDRRPLPTNDSSDVEQQSFLAWLLRSVLDVKPDLLFCSEAYGPPCAAMLTGYLKHTVKAVVVDLRREAMPINSTQIREHPRNYRDWMSCEVRASFVHRIAVLGGESSGKTTLTAALAAHFDTHWIPEYGREFWQQQSGVLSQADLTRIAQEQIRREDAGLLDAKDYLFCDTSPLTTVGYSGWMFGRVDKTLAALAHRHYDAIVLCRPDFPFVQDGTRRDDSFRQQQHQWYLGQLKERQTPVLEVTGSKSQRVESVAAWLVKETVVAKNR